MTEVTGRLEQWEYDRVHNIIWGNLYDDIRDRWHDGARIRTSLIQSHLHGEAKTGDTIITMNSSYLLGEEYTGD